ncbi:UNVERIFIED_CONTAM: hypothetical protein Sangu_0922700 [Sesamum angustifolium]|uniref:Uncharacterized protein n=1 Tax=Sesamum angustifolium TaxID=2727405 RepID=A0AAW2PC13_9LAMI
MADGGGGRIGPDFNLSDEILSVIPTDPYDQLDLARKITSMAIASRVSKLETEAGRLRQQLHEKDRLIEGLEDKVSQLDSAYQDAELRLKLTREDNLESFKRQLMQSLNEENSPQTETVDIGTYDQNSAQGLFHKCSIDTASINGVWFSSNIGNDHTDYFLVTVSKQAGQRFSITPYITPRLTPTGTPKIISASVSPRRYSAAGSPQRTSGAASPTTHYEGRGSLSSWYSSSQQSSAANSPPRARPPPARTPRIDGKEFFRQARSRLSSNSVHF